MRRFSRRLSPRPVYWLMAGVSGVMLFASSLPSVLYVSYRMLWSLSPGADVAYAVYAFAVPATLVLAGSGPDRIGRRPVLLVVLASLIGSDGAVHVG
jgi:MFS family permease